jgi:putative ABC transport system permease protein
MKIFASNVFSDIRHGVRSLRRNPTYSLPAVCLLALGIGANTAIFSFVYTVLLRPLPYKNSRMLAEITRKDITRPGIPEPVTAGDFLGISSKQSVFSKLVLYEPEAVILSDHTGTTMLVSAGTSPGLFDLFEAAPTRGRAFRADEFQPGKDTVAILSYSLWQNRFDGDPGILGKQVVFDKVSRTVVGIAPYGFDFPVFGPYRTDVWFPLAITQKGLNDKSKYMVARLNVDTSLRQAQSAMETLSTQILTEEQGRERWRVASLQEASSRRVRPIVQLLFGASGFVLFLACANVIGLLMARSARREKEMAIRQAMGARPLRLMRHLLSESAIVGLLGGTLGLLVAYGGVRLLTHTAPGIQHVLGAATITLDYKVLLFALGISLAGGILAGLIPAATGSRQEIVSRLREGKAPSSWFGRGSLRLRDGLLASQMGAALLLLICSGALLYSLVRLTWMDTGFYDPGHVLTIFVTSPDKDARSQDAHSYEEMVERIHRLPEVAAVGVATGNFFTSAGRYSIEPTDGRFGEELSANIRHVSPGYFEAVGTYRLQGRYLDDTDGHVASTATSRAIIDETLARRAWPGQSPLGKHFRFARKVYEVVGLVKATHDASLNPEPVPTIYLDYRDSTESTMCLIVRTKNDPHPFADSLRTQILAVDNSVFLSQALTLDELHAAPLSTLRLQTLLLGIFAALALSLATVGIYGAVAYAVAERTRDIAVCKAFGADRVAIFMLLVGRIMKVGLWGFGVGLLGALLVTPRLSTMFSFMSASALWTYLIPSIILAMVAFLAAYIPTRRAIQTDILTCLRHE